ncbi:MAG: TolC family protein [Bradymonadaceae bacterium]
MLPLAVTAAESSEGQTTTDAEQISLADYVETYMADRPALNRAEVAVDKQKLRVDRALDARKSDVSVDSGVGSHLYDYTSPFPFRPVGYLRTDGTYTDQFADGTQLEVDLHSRAPMESHPTGGTLQYGASGAVRVPVPKNRNGRLYELRADVARAETEASRNDLRAEKLFSCRDAIIRYVVSYVARRRLEVYRDLLDDKRSIYYQTDADYRKKMVSRLDYLAARSDWLEAKSREQQYIAAVDRADASLRAFGEVPSPAALRRPDWKAAPDASGEALRERIAESHPKAARYEARRRAAQREQKLIRERLRTQLDLGVTVGVDRLHDRIDPAGRPADVTDAYVLGTLRLRWPIRRPRKSLDIELLGLRQQKLEHARRQTVRELTEGVRRARSRITRSRSELNALEEQLKVSERRIAEAREQYRAGKLEFQDFLDHWQPYQRTRLRLWELRRTIWRTRAELIPMLDYLPEVCR